MRDITIVEVSPRDGLQNESEILSTDAKVDLITRLVDAGARRIEAVSFAHPKLVPTMADAEAVMAGDVVDAAHDHGLSTTITLATAFGCPFEGEVNPARVAEFARRCAESGVQELGLADTVGVGAQSQVTDLTARMRDAVGELPLRFHFHNTRNTGFANAYAAVAEGVDVLDASAGGIGGCPFAPKATGNISTDDLVYMLERMGHRTGIDLTTLLPTAEFLGEQLGHEVPALLPRAGAFP